MAQDTAERFANRAPLKGTGPRNHFRLGEWKIGTLLTACFAAIVLLMIVGDVIAVLQLHWVETRASRFYQADQKSLAILHVYLDVVTFRDTLTSLAHDQNPDEFASRATALRDNFLRDVTRAQGTLSATLDVNQDPTILIRLQTVRAAMPSQVDALLELVKAGDWQAVSFRLAGQAQPLIALSSSLVADVEQEVAQERAQALESVQRTRRQLYLVLSITALLILLMAAMLGWYTTRRISRPLARLDARAQALARGEFGYEVELQGNDELADLARAFDYADQQLHKLYDDIKRSEAYLAESKAKLEEAQRIAHVGYWEWDLLTNRVNWSDETYRIYGLQPQEGSVDLATVRERIDPEDWRRGMEEALGGGARFNAECRVFRPTGEVRIAHFQGDVKRDASGRPCQMFGTVQDITDRKRAEEALQQSQFYLNEGQRLAHIGSWAFNATGFSYWSSELFRIYGLDPGGKPPTVEEYLALIHLEDRGFLKQAIAKLLDDHFAFDFTKRIVRPDGEIRHLRCVGVPVTQGGVFQGFLGTGIDVTEQERLTEELRRSEKELRDVIDTIPAIVWSTLPDGSNTYVNRRFIEYSGLSAEQATELGWKMAVHPDDLERQVGKWMEAIDTGKPLESEVRLRRSDGQYRWQMDRGIPLHDENGNIVKWYGVVTDIEDRKRAEDALGALSRDLQESKAKLEEAQRIAHVGYWEWDLTSNRVIWSDETYRIYGLQPREYPIDIAVIGKLIHPEDLEFVFRVAEEAVRGGLRTDAEHRIIRPTGEVRTVHSQGDLKKDASGRICQMFGTVQDITDRKRAEEALRQRETEIRTLNEQMIKTQEAERMRIAGELHDGVLQQITSLTLRLGSVKRQVPADSEAKATVNRLQQELIQIGTDIRHISHELHPALLQEAGLPAALSSYCEEFSDVRGLPVECETEESVKELSPGAALCLYRIAQEALGNAAKYSHAEKVEVRLTRSDGRVCLLVSDDGVGCDPDQITKSGRLGVANMRERVLQFNGTFEFDSEPGHGTRVTVTLPFTAAS